MKFSLINVLASALLFVGIVKAVPIDSRQMTPDYNPVISQVLEVQENEKRDDGLREPANKHFNWELGMVI